MVARRKTYGGKAAVFCFLLLCSTLHVYLYSQSSSPNLVVTSRLVALDVSVTDARGNTVTDLKKSDFRITENGIKQNVIAIEPPSAHVIAGNPPIHGTADLPKLGSSPLTILVLDEMNGLFEENSYARYSIDRFLKAAPAQLSQATALLAETNSGFTILADFTRDRATLAEALRRHPATLPTRRMQGGSGGSGGMERVIYTLNCIQQIAEAYAGYPGRKNIIWVGNALPGVDTSSMPPEDAAIITTTIERATNILLGTHTVLYTIDPRANSSSEIDYANALDYGGLGTSSLSDPGVIDPLASAQNFGLIASYSGGASISGRNAIDQVIREILSTGTNYYTVFYRPSSTSDVAQEYRKIGIQIRRPALRVVARQGYFANTPPQTQVAAESLNSVDSRALLSLDLSNAATDGLTYTGLSVHARIVDLGKLDVSVDCSSLSFGTADRPSADLVVLLAPLDAKHRLLNTRRVYHVQFGEPKPGTKDMVIHLPFAAENRSRSLRVIVRDMHSGRIGSDELHLQ